MFKTVVMVGNSYRHRNWGYLGKKGSRRSCRKKSGAGIGKGIMQAQEKQSGRSQFAITTNQILTSLLCYLIALLPSFDTITTDRKPVAERPVTSHTYPIRSLPQGRDNLVSASRDPAMGSSNTDHLKQLEETQEWPG